MKILRWITPRVSTEIIQYSNQITRAGKVIGIAQFIPLINGVEIRIEEVTDDPEKIKIFLVSRGYLRDKP